MTAADLAGAPFRLIVGLGNPGRQYAQTRHNVGFVLVDDLAQRDGSGWTTEKKWEGAVAKGNSGIVYLKPLTFMNLSGRSVAAVARFYKIAADQILLVYDDADLPLGSLRFRKSGSAGGHNGVKSVIESMGTDSFARLKIGVAPSGESRSRDLADHVLSKFSG